MNTRELGKKLREAVAEYSLANYRAPGDELKTEFPVQISVWAPDLKRKFRLKLDFEDTDQ